MTPTEEQAAILSCASSSQTSMMISAYAGTGKTTTLVMLAEALPKTPSLALAFNKKIAEELTRRFPAHFLVKTMNGLGHSAWSRYTGKRPEVDGQKLGKLITKLARENGLTLEDDDWNDTRLLVSAAMNQGLLPDISDFRTFQRNAFVTDTQANWTDLALEHDIKPDLWQFAREVLIASIKLGMGSGGKVVISYDDQIYLPVLLGANFQKFPCVMVDEAQDLSPLQHEMVRKSCSNRLIVVGDPKQAIYAFRGADHTSMEKLRGLRDSWEDLPLTLTFRCPKVVVARQQEHAPGYRAAEGNVEGRILDLRGQEDGWDWSAIPSGEVAVLCRLNAPIVSLALKLLSRHIAVVMLGRDLGKGLVRLAKKILPDPNIPTNLCIPLVEAWREEESQLARANQKPHKIAGIDDKADCLLAVLEHCKTSGDLQSVLNDIFSREHGQVTLATGHRAKGLEWDTVVHLDPFRIPSAFAKKAAAQGHRGQLEQEYNLKYVIETRAKKNLVFANLEDFV